MNGLHPVHKEYQVLKLFRIRIKTDVDVLSVILVGSQDILCSLEALTLTCDLEIEIRGLCVYSTVSFPLWKLCCESSVMR